MLWLGDSWLSIQVDQNIFDWHPDWAENLGEEASDAAGQTALKICETEKCQQAFRDYAALVIWTRVMGVHAVHILGFICPNSLFQCEFGHR